MSNLRRLIRTTLIGGVLFLLPLIFVVVVLGKAFQIMKVIGTPIGNLIPVESFAGFAVVEIVTLLILFLSCLFAGLLARSPWGQKLYLKLDTILLQLIPGYAWMKGVTGDLKDEDAESVLKPVLVRFDDQSQLAYEVDRTEDGWVAVYLPGAPDSRSGAVSYVTSDRVKSVDIDFKAVAKICRNLGRGSREVLSAQTG